MITLFETILNYSETFTGKQLLGIIVLLSALYFACYLTKGIALLVMSKKRGIKNGWFAFVPFLSTYILGKIAGDVSIFRYRIKNFGLYAALIEFAFVLFSVLFYGFGYGKDIVLFAIGNISSADINNTILVKLLYYIRYIFLLMNSVSFIFLYIAIFRKYAPRYYFPYTFLSVIFDFLPGFFLISLMNKEPFDYDAYVKKQMERMRSNGYNNQYGGYNPYGRNGFGGFGNFGNDNNSENTGKPQNFGEDPFEEFADKNSKYEGDNCQKPSGNSMRENDDKDKKDDDDFFN